VANVLSIMEAKKNNTMEAKESFKNLLNMLFDRLKCESE
jgi:hypothetical protein